MLLSPCQRGDVIDQYIIQRDKIMIYFIEIIAFFGNVCNNLLTMLHKRGGRIAATSLNLLLS
jgi:hypothetical protein